MCFLYLISASSMNHLIIIGNGFDLAHGLKTSYRDYVRAMMIDSMLVLGQRQFQNSPFHLSNLCYSQPNFTHTDLLEREDFMRIEDSKLQQFYNDNLQNYRNRPSYFAKGLISDLGDKGWVDLEDAYHRRLWEIKHDKSDVDSLNEDVQKLTTSLAQYLTGVSLDGLQPYSEIETHFRSIINQEKWREQDMLEQAVSDLEDRMQDLKSNTTRYKKLKEELEEQSDLLRSIEHSRVVVLTFNYTETFDRYADLFPKGKCEVVHIHGSLLEDNILLGYGDEESELYKELEKMNDNNLTRYFKSFYYARSTCYEGLFRFLDSGKFRVHLMGHSCGLSDRVLLSNIFQHEQLEKVKIYYHDKGSGQNDFFDRVQNISRHFADKHRMRRKILPFSDGNGAHEDNKDRSVPLIRVGE